MLILWSGTNFHVTSGVHSQKPHSSKPSKSTCLARITSASLKVFVLFATPVADWVSRLGCIFCASLPPLPHFCHFWSLLLAAVLLLAAFACFVDVVVIVLFYAVLLWSASRWGALEVFFLLILIIITALAVDELNRDKSNLVWSHGWKLCYVCTPKIIFSTSTFNSGTMIQGLDWFNLHEHTFFSEVIKKNPT